MITNNEKRHYLSVKSLSALFKGQNSKDNGDFSCLNCLHSFRTKKKTTKTHENVCKNHDYCCIKMPKDNKNILKYNHRKKSIKVPFII